MIAPEPSPRSDLFTNLDADACAEQFFLLSYVLHMTPEQIAQVDFGLDPDHPNAWAAFAWADGIRQTFPRVDARAMIRNVDPAVGSTGDDRPGEHGSLPQKE